MNIAEHYTPGLISFGENFHCEFAEGQNGNLTGFKKFWWRKVKFRGEVVVDGSVRVEKLFPNAVILPIPTIEGPSNQGEATRVQEKTVVQCPHPNEILIVCNARFSAFFPGNQSQSDR